MTEPTTALSMRVAGVPLPEIADHFGLSLDVAAQQLQTELEASPYGNLGPTFTLHLLRCDALAAALDRAEIADSSPGERARIDQHRTTVRAMHQGALDTANRAAIAQADRGRR